MKKLVELSLSDDYDEALNEWIQIDIGGKKKVKMETECICERSISNVCSIVNKLNGNMVLCGTTCINKIRLKNMYLNTYRKKYKNYAKIYGEIIDIIVKKKKLKFSSNDDYLKYVDNKILEKYLEIIKKTKDKLNLKKIYDEVINLHKIYHNNDVINLIIESLNKKQFELYFNFFVLHNLSRHYHNFMSRHIRRKEEEERKKQQLKNKIEIELKNKHKQKQKKNKKRRLEYAIKATKEDLEEMIHDELRRHHYYPINDTIKFLTKLLDMRDDIHFILELIEIAVEKKNTLNKLHEKGVC